MIPRLGVYDRWSTVKSVKRDLLSYLETFASYQKKYGTLDRLEHYANTGQRHPSDQLPPTFQSNPPPMWRYPVNQLGYRSGWLECQGILKLLDGDSSGWALLNQGNTASYIGSYADYQLIAQWTRGPDHVGASMNSIYSTVGMAFVLGHRRDAERQARLVLESYRRGHFGCGSIVDTHPVYHLLLRIWADWMEIDPPEWGRGATQEPILNELFSNWKLADPDALAPYLLNACDFHTHRCRVTKKGSQDWYEFETKRYHRFPVEILTIFRIRQWMGLSNPKLDHPLMGSLLGVLPPEMKPEMDDLTRSVHDRMCSQGFDEDAIYRMMLPG